MRYTVLQCTLFHRYTPQSIELDHKLRPFIPDYIPAVGDIDAFLKVKILRILVSKKYEKFVIAYHVDDLY